MAIPWLHTNVLGVKTLLSQLLTQKTSFAVENTPPQSGKVAIVTGGNRGIGYETVRGLCRKGMHVVMACRSRESAETVIQQVKKENATARVEFMELDLARFRSIQQFVETFKTVKDLPLHLLVCNAGTWATSYQPTEDGFEMNFGVNHLGHFILIHMLLDCLRESGMEDNFSRIVIMSSEAHRVGKGEFERNQERENFSFYSYADSKLANVLFTYDLQRRLQAEGCYITVNCVHPGVVNTGLFDDFHWLVKAPQDIAANFLFRTPEQGAETTLYVALSAELEGIGGGYFGNCQKQESSLKSLDQSLQRKLWDYSCEVTGIHQSKYLH